MPQFSLIGKVLPAHVDQYLGSRPIMSGSERTLNKDLVEGKRHQKGAGDNDDELGKYTYPPTDYEIADGDDDGLMKDIHRVGRLALVL